MMLSITGFPGSSVDEESTAIQETLVRFMSQEVPLEKEQDTLPVFLSFHGGSDDQESTGNARDMGLIVEAQGNHEICREYKFVQSLWRTVWGFLK